MISEKTAKEICSAGGATAITFELSKDGKTPKFHCFLTTRKGEKTYIALASEPTKKRDFLAHGCIKLAQTLGFKERSFVSLGD